jgi:HipA-like C-terminal domain
MALQLAEQVARTLAAGMSTANELASALKVSQPSISRAIAELDQANRILRLGNTRGARYGLRHSVADIGSSWPLYRIGEDSSVTQLATLHALAANGFFVEPRATIAQDNLCHRIANLDKRASTGLPYYLQDQRPNGFLGRTVPRQYPELHLPQRVNDWSDEHFLRYFTRHGSNAVSNLVLGEAALNEWLATRKAQIVVKPHQREHHYAQMAETAMMGGLPGSSAHGEQPKFAACIQADTGSQQVLVKFSPPRHSVVGQRWSDLLIAEHLAHRLLNESYAEHRLLGCESEIMITDERTFLEVHRFDRQGEFGRIGVTSLFSIDAELYGRLDNWIAAAVRLFADQHIDAFTLRSMRLATAFGSLIGNTDQHFGNLAFFDDYSGPFQLAPIYDMLPMFFAPEHDQLMTRAFQAPHATADTLEVWNEARSLAVRYWNAVENDARISQAFRVTAASCRKLVDAS